MARYMKVIGKITLETVMENILGQMARYMKVIGKMAI
jgi:hypothetical protein